MTRRHLQRLRRAYRDEGLIGIEKMLAEPRGRSTVARSAMFTEIQRKLDDEHGRRRARPGRCSAPEQADAVPADGSHGPGPSQFRQRGVPAGISEPAGSSVHARDCAPAWRGRAHRRHRPSPLAQSMRFHSPELRSVTPGSIGGSRPAPKDHGGVSTKMGNFSEQVWGISGERQHRRPPARTAHATFTAHRSPVITACAEVPAARGPSRGRAGRPRGSCAAVVPSALPRRAAAVLACRGCGPGGLPSGPCPRTARTGLPGAGRQAPCGGTRPGLRDGQ